MSLSRFYPVACASRGKVFGSFFQKRTASLLHVRCHATLETGQHTHIPTTTERAYQIEVGLYTPRTQAGCRLLGLQLRSLGRPPLPGNS